MPAARMDMRKLKELLRLKLEWGLKHRQIERALDVSVGAASKYCALAQATGLSWPAISVYVLVAIIKKELKLEASLHTLLQVLSVTLFEKIPLQQVVADIEPGADDGVMVNQLKLFDF